MNNNNLSLLEIKGLTKIFSLGNIFSRIRIIAVNNVTFSIEPAEIFTLAGESGSGKTTVARMILGFVEPTRGHILYRGQDISNLREKTVIKLLRKEVQGIFQNPFETFNPLRKVVEYFYETIRNFNVEGNKDEIIDKALKSVGLSLGEIKDKYPGEFSGGQLQRISIARALITKPSLLLADEPVSMVDASLRMSIINLFKELKEKNNVSVIYITHDLATAYYISDKIAIMFRGEIVELGPVEKVLTKPKHPYTMLLKESIPEPDLKKKWQGNINLITTEEEEYLAKGCKFSGRCPYAMDICRRESPNNIKVDEVLVKCHLYK